MNDTGDEMTASIPRIDVADLEILRASCCMTGCQNCVWLKYVDELFAATNNADSQQEEARRAQLAQIKRQVDQMSDESLKAFLLMEINAKLKSS